jgi:hypothetical protein
MRADHSSPKPPMSNLRPGIDGDPLPCDTLVFRVGKNSQRSPAAIERRNRQSTHCERSVGSPMRQRAVARWSAGTSTPRCTAPRGGSAQDGRNSGSSNSPCLYVCSDSHHSAPRDHSRQEGKWGGPRRTDRCGLLCAPESTTAGPGARRAHRTAGRHLPGPGAVVPASRYSSAATRGNRDTST